MTAPSRGSKSAGEFELIARYLAPLAAAEGGALGLLDDAAVFDPEAGWRQVISTDAMVEGVHFPDAEDAETVATRALGAGVSDLAAMGALPEFYTLALAFPKAWDGAQRESWMIRFTAALDARQAQLGIRLIGGDTVATPGPLWVSLTSIGRVPLGREIRRSGAVADDVIWVSGSIGDGALGLKVLSGVLTTLPHDMGQALIKRFQRPEPRIALGRHLVGLAHAAADISDGLIADLTNICAASRVSATIDIARIPLSIPAQTAVDMDSANWAVVLSGGDDYEIVFTSPSNITKQVIDVARESGTAVTAIGHVDAVDTDASPLVRILGVDGREVSLGGQGYRHF